MICTRQLIESLLACSFQFKMKKYGRRCESSQCLYSMRAKMSMHNQRAAERTAAASSQFLLPLANKSNQFVSRHYAR